MAKTGIKYPVAAPGKYIEGTEPVYTNGFVIGSAMAVDKEVKFTSTPLYANNIIVEDEFMFESGSLKIGVDDILEEAQSKMFGHLLIDDSSGENPIIRKSAGDVPPFLGVGYYKTGLKDSVKYYEATWIYKVKFMPPKESAKTSEGKTTWQTAETEGTIYTVAGYENEIYEDTKRFPTEAAAKKWINDKAGINAEQPSDI